MRAKSFAILRRKVRARIKLIYETKWWFLDSEIPTIQLIQARPSSLFELCRPKYDVYALYSYPDLILLLIYVCMSVYHKVKKFSCDEGEGVGVGLPFLRHP